MRCDKFELSTSYFMNSSKSQMGSKSADETLLMRYLLGKLNDRERVEVEDRAFTEPEYLGALEGAEADLIDSYVRKELPKSDRDAFERQFLTSASRRRKVEFAKTFVRVAGELHESPISEQRSAWQIFAARFRIWDPALRFAAGIAALCCLLGVLWLSVDLVLMRSRLVALESQQRDSELGRQTLLRRLSKAQSRIADVTKPGQRPPTENSAMMASLVLASGISRSQSNVPVLVLPPSVQIARIEIELESRDAFPRFRAGLRTSTGAEVLTYGSLVPRRTPTGNVVAFDVPASTFSTGNYELALQGLSPGQPAQDIAYHYFRVQR